MLMGGMPAMRPTLVSARMAKYAWSWGAVEVRAATARAMSVGRIMVTRFYPTYRKSYYEPDVAFSIFARFPLQVVYFWLFRALSKLTSAERSRD